MPVVWMKSSSMIKIYATSCFPADHINPVSTHSQRRGVDVYLSFQVPFYLTYCWKNRSPLMYLSKSKLLKNRKKKKREETCYICKTKYQQNKSIKKKVHCFLLISPLLHFPYSCCPLIRLSVQHLRPHHEYLLYVFLQIVTVAAVWLLSSHIIIFISRHCRCQG